MYTDSYVRQIIGMHAWSVFDTRIDTCTGHAHGEINGDSLVFASQDQSMYRRYYRAAACRVHGRVSCGPGEGETKRAGSSSKVQTSTSRTHLYVLFQTAELNGTGDYI